VNKLLIGLLGALVVTNQVLASSNIIQQSTGLPVSITNSNETAETELEQLMAKDDAAQAEVTKWIQDNNAFAAQGAGESKAELNRRIMARLSGVRAGYEDFLRRYPNSAGGHLAYGSFLNDIGEEEAAMRQNETASQLDPKNPAAWNNLANYYCENGLLTNAFTDYAKAIELNPTESVYYENFATVVYLYRKDARDFYHINEQQVFDKSLALYRKAMQLDPDNFRLATDCADSYYEIRPLRTNEMLAAWSNALQIAHNDIEREGVYIHLARIQMLAGRYVEARAQLAAVTNATYADLKHTLERNITERENKATNSMIVSTNTTTISTNVVIAPTNTPASDK
jgi:tetratricopeptide (TPR) repeat protein